MFLEIFPLLWFCCPLICNNVMLMTVLMVAVWKAAGGLDMSYTHVLATQLNTGPVFINNSLCLVLYSFEENNCGMLVRHRKRRACHYAGWILLRQPSIPLCFASVFLALSSLTSLLCLCQYQKHSQL